MQSTLPMVEIGGYFYLPSCHVVRPCMYKSWPLKISPALTSMRAQPQCTRLPHYSALTEHVVLPLKMY